MSRRLVALTIAIATVAALSLGVAPALAGLSLTNWAVWGTLTPKTLNEPVNLPKASRFNGLIEFTHFTEGELQGTATGKLTVPPFDASLRLVGLVPTTVGVTITQVGEAEGTVEYAPPSSCSGARFNGDCATLDETAKANIGITAAGVLGIEVPTHCETTEPVVFPLKETDTIGDTLELGLHFTGTTAIPPIECEGLSGVALAALLTSLMSGPENPFDLHIAPREPAAPAVVTKPASGVSQASGTLDASVNPDGEEVGDCHFEYGLETSYGSSIPCSYVQGDGYAVRAVLGGLEEGVTYHYRAVATNALGSTYGADESFTTLTSTGSPEYGQCVPAKKGNYVDSNCTTFGMKKGVAVEHKGSYEWVAGAAPTCVAKKRGEYIDAGCSTHAAKAGKGAYERAPGPGFTSTTGPVTLQAQGLSRTVLCTAGSGEGEVTGTKTAVQRLRLTGCESEGKRCRSEGPNSTPSGSAGEIDTNLLDTRLLGPVAGQVWTQLRSGEHSPYLAEVGCEGSSVRLTGELAGIQSADVDVSSAVGSTKFAVGEGEQALYTGLSENGGETWLGPDASDLIGVASDTAASKTEIRP